MKFGVVAVCLALACSASAHVLPLPLAYSDWPYAQAISLAKGLPIGSGLVSPVSYAHHVAAPAIAAHLTPAAWPAVLPAHLAPAHLAPAHLARAAIAAPLAPAAIAAPLAAAAIAAPIVPASASYVATTRGAQHIAPLPGHIESVASTNVEPAPGTL